MGIGGISYTDGRGRRKNLDVDSLEEFKRQFGAAPHAARRRAMPPLPVPESGGAAPKPETMPGSAVVETHHGLALKGEENDPTVQGKKVYGSVDGVKGYHTLDEIDPVPGGGRRLGHDDAASEAADDTPDGDSVDGFDGCPVSVPFVSRVSVTGGENGVYEIYQFQRETRYSAGRRAGAVTAEKKLEVGTIVARGGGSDAPDYPYAVKKLKGGADGDDPSYGIYLPANILYVAGEQPDLTANLDSVQNKTDWYALPGGHRNGPLYLHVTLPYDENGESESDSGEGERHDAEAEIVTTKGTPGEHDLYIEIANISENSITQKVAGTLVIAGGGEGVKSLNGLTGDVTIKGGAGVSVEEDDVNNSITIMLRGGSGGGDCQADDVSIDSYDKPDETGGGSGEGSEAGGEGGEGGEGSGETPAATTTKTYELKGWRKPGISDTTLADLALPGGNGTDPGKYEVVVRMESTDGGKSLAYLPLGPYGGKKLILKDGNDKSITLDAAAINSQSCKSTAIAVKKLTVPVPTNVDPSATIDYHILACADINLRIMKYVTDVTFEDVQESGKTVKKMKVSYSVGDPVFRDVPQGGDTIHSIEFEWTSDSQLRIKLMKDEKTMLKDGLLPIFKKDVVESMEYKSHELSYKIAHGVRTDETTSVQDAKVFEATAHSKEHQV